jgi:hypothetical protein
MIEVKEFRFSDPLIPPVPSAPQEMSGWLIYRPAAPLIYRDPWYRVLLGYQGG